MTDSMLPVDFTNGEAVLFAKILPELPEDGEETHYLSDAFHDSKKALELLESSDEESVDTCDDNDTSEYRVWSKDTLQTALERRYSSKWVREKGGQRRVEEDYSHILNALRSL